MDLPLSRQSDPGPLHGKRYCSRILSPRPLLVAVLHGDAPFQKPDAQYALAQHLADENDDVVAVGLLRPGYTDREGVRSPGKRGWATGDNYTPEAIQAVADTILNLQDMYQARHVLVVGHSGGAAVAACLLGKIPGLIGSAVLVGCPCDVPRFRKHMRGRRTNPVWKALWTLPVRSLSPLDFVPDIEQGARISIVVGENDDVTPAAFTHDYAERLRARDIPVQVTVLEGGDHDIFLRREVRSIITELLNQKIGSSECRQPNAVGI